MHTRAHTQHRQPHEDRGSKWSHVSTSQRAPRISSDPQKLRRGKEGFFRRACGGSVAWRSGQKWPKARNKPPKRDQAPDTLSSGPAAAPEGSCGPSAGARQPRCPHRLGVEGQVEGWEGSQCDTGRPGAWRKRSSVSQRRAELQETASPILKLDKDSPA